MFNGDHIMTAGEIRRPAMGPIGEVRQPVHSPCLVGFGEAAAGHRAEAASASGAILPPSTVEAFLSQDETLLPMCGQRSSNCCSGNASLESELSRQRELLQEWILSQLTYKALYYRYSGQSLEAPRSELTREKDEVRRRIRDQLQAGGRPHRHSRRAVPQSVQTVMPTLRVGELSPTDSASGFETEPASERGRGGSWNSQSAQCQGERYGPTVQGGDTHRTGAGRAAPRTLWI
ncbi:hypothetical protein ACU4GD_07080 [Cupriavidus basilensis]